MLQCHLRWVHIFHILLYLLGIYGKTKFKERFYVFLKGLDDPQKLLKEFWDIHMDKIKPWYIKQMREDDVIISASPEFLVKEAMGRLGNAVVMASVVDMFTGTYTGINCCGQEKVRRFYERYPDAVIHRFYSDSESDAPLELFVYSETNFSQTYRQLLVCYTVLLAEHLLERGGTVEDRDSFQCLCFCRAGSAFYGQKVVISCGRSPFGIGKLDQTHRTCLPHSCGMCGSVEKQKDKPYSNPCGGLCCCHCAYWQYIPDQQRSFRLSGHYLRLQSDHVCLQ